MDEPQNSVETIETAPLVIALKLLEDEIRFCDLAASEEVALRPVLAQWYSERAGAFKRVKQLIIRRALTLKRDIDSHC